MNNIKWLIAQYRIISLENMEKKIEESENKDFVYYLLLDTISFSSIFNLFFIFGFFQIIYSYDDNIFYIAKSKMRKSREFIIKMQNLDKDKPINSAFNCRAIDDSELNRISFFILQMIANITSSIEGFIHIVFLPLRIPLYLISFIKYLR